MIPGKQSLSSYPWDSDAESELGLLPIYILSHSPQLIHITKQLGFFKCCIWYKGVTQRLGTKCWCLSKRCTVWSTGYHCLWFYQLCLSPNMSLSIACTRHRSLSASTRAKFRFGIADCPSLEVRGTWRNESFHKQSPQGCSSSQPSDLLSLPLF